MIEVKWTFRARGRLREIYKKIADDQPGNADRFIDRLIDRGESLSVHALRGRIVPEYKNPAIREVFEGEYRIIYQAKDRIVAILTVRGFAELLPTDPKQL